MDWIALAFYACVCGGLGIAAPFLGGFLPRLAVGAVVGICAAILLPLLRGLMGGY